MEQFTIKGLPQLLLSKGLLEDLSRRVDKLNFYDKCNWVITAIARKNYAVNKSFDKYVEIHSSRFKQVLGRDYYLKVINALESLGLVDVNHSYSAGRNSKSYRLTPKAIDTGIATDIVRNKQFESRLNRLAEADYKEVIKNPVFERILYNTAQLHLLNEPFYFVERLLPESKFEEINGYLYDISEPYNEFQMKRYEDYYKGFKALNKTSTPLEVYKSPLCFKPIISEYGRVYHIAASIPKHIRKCLRTKANDIIWEVDMSSAQLSLLVLEWLKQTKELKSNIDEQEREEIKICLRLLNEGGFYAYIQRNSDYCHKMEYDKLKLSILKTLNATTKPSRIFKELKRLFPFFLKFIVQMKIPDHTKVSHMGFMAESNIFIKEFMSLPKDVFAIPIHDCILTTEKYVHLVKKCLIRRTKSIYKDILPTSFSLEGLFKLARVSLIDEETYESGINEYYQEIRRDIFE